MHCRRRYCCWTNRVSVFHLLKRGIVVLLDEENVTEVCDATAAEPFASALGACVEEPAPAKPSTPYLR